jgi:3-deoxy-D-manno-octulosonate 8-phosphate phosphatase (KDO 8-P phosphatase)
VRGTDSTIQSRLEAIELVIFDADGVLTDGSIWLGDDGREMLRFSVLDGYGIFRGYRVGLTYAIITGRTSEALLIRANRLEIDRVYRGQTIKQGAFDEIVADSDLHPRQIAFVGDDLNDLPIMRQVGISCAVANARDEVRAEADIVTTARGGEGAVREFLEMIIAAKGGVPSP